MIKRLFSLLIPILSTIILYVSCSGEAITQTTTITKNETLFKTVSITQITTDTVTVEPPVQKITFQSNRDGDTEIYVMNKDGSNVMQLTHNTAGDTRPSWSPDGQQIVFFSNRDGDTEIYVMNADGSNVVQLTDNTAWDVNPSWSP